MEIALGRYEHCLEKNHELRRVVLCVCAACACACVCVRVRSHFGPSHTGQVLGAKIQAARSPMAGSSSSMHSEAAAAAVLEEDLAAALAEEEPLSGASEALPPAVQAQLAAHEGAERAMAEQLIMEQKQQPKIFLSRSWNELFSRSNLFSNFCSNLF